MRRRAARRSRAPRAAATRAKRTFFVFGFGVVEGGGGCVTRCALACRVGSAGADREQPPAVPRDRRAAAFLSSASASAKAGRIGAGGGRGKRGALQQEGTLLCRVARRRPEDRPRQARARSRAGRRERRGGQRRALRRTRVSAKVLVPLRSVGAVSFRKTRVDVMCAIEVEACLCADCGERRWGLLMTL